MFLEKWNLSDKRSEISGKDLSHIEVGSNMWRRCMAHVLPKGKYPLYRTYIENMMLLDPEEHQLVDQGTEEQRKAYKNTHPFVKWEIFYSKQEELKRKYPNR